MLIALRLIVVTAVFSTSLLLSFGAQSMGRSDPPGNRDGNHCVNAFDVDLNVLYGMSEQFRMFDCQTISAGEHWIRPLWWIVHFEEDSVYPPGYVPALPAPVDDFASKLVSLRVVIDGGTRQERTYIVSPAGIVRTDIDIEQLEPGAGWGAAYPMASILPRLRPLSVGAHFLEAYLVLSAEHCDGVTTDPDLSCLPAGEIQFSGHPVVFSKPGH